jgi:hypothetical protein
MFPVWHSARALQASDCRVNAILPRRIPKAPKRSSRWRSQAHCNHVRSHECCVIGCGGRPIEVAHVRINSGAGAAQKPDDWRTVSLCQFHHTMQHQMGERQFWYTGRVSVRDPEELIAEFIRTSPKRHEIEQVRKGREQ